MPNALQTLLGLQQQGGGGADVLRLAKLRQDRRAEFDERAGMGDPRAQASLARIDQDIALDPDTGLEQRNRQADIEDQLSQAATYQRPEVRDVRNEEEGNALRRLLLPVQARAQVDSATDQAQFAQQLLRDRLNQEAIGGRQEASQQAVAERTAATQQATTNRALLNSLIQQRRDAQTRLGKTTSLGRLFGSGRTAQSEIDDLTARINAAATSGGGGGETGGESLSPEDAASTLVSMFPNASMADLMRQVSFDTPAEAAALQAALARMGVQ